MEINLNSKMAAGWGVERETLNVQNGVQPKVGDGVQASRISSAGQNADFSTAVAFDALQGSEPIADVPASALLRDDDLGKLVDSAFCLPPPAMPEFQDTV